MAVQQRKIKPALKRQLYKEAGEKCANPGCSNWRAHIHHIKHWAVYKCHNAADMIALCPSCHDSAHYGKLQISDDVLYLWKGVERQALPETTHLYIEPAKEVKLLTGTCSLMTSNPEMIVFEFSNSNRLKLRILDGDLLQVSVLFKNQSGKDVFRVVENNVRVVRDKAIDYEFRAGRSRITVPATDEYIPKWVVEQMQSKFPDFISNNRVVALDLEVLKPGVLRVQGFWPSEKSAVVINLEALSFCVPGREGPFSIIGEGEETGFIFEGPITTALFGFR